MKNTLYVVVVLVLIIIGFVMFNNKEEEIDLYEVDDTNLENTPVSNEVPVNINQDVEENEAITENSVVKEFTVEGTNFAFVPSTITVKKGDKVKITFKNTQGFHDFVIDNYGVATKQFKSPGEEVIEFIADKSGTFEFYCSVGSHKSQGMKGVLKVE